jgi:hypothetical protein
MSKRLGWSFDNRSLKRIYKFHTTGTSINSPQLRVSFLLCSNTGETKLRLAREPDQIISPPPPLYCRSMIVSFSMNRKFQTEAGFRKNRSHRPIDLFGAGPNLLVPFTPNYLHMQRQ